MSIAEKVKLPDLAEIAAMLSLRLPADRESLRARAEATMREHVGDRVYYRGLIEFSNVCARNCYYCGIRAANHRVRRYTLTIEEILAAARSCATLGYGSVTLQSGERRDPAFVDFVCSVVEAVKRETRSAQLPDGLGITLCVGEQSEAAYRRMFAAGAHRYLLRIETSNRTLFEQIHPAHQSYDSRVECLAMLRQIGFQLGTGVMIGLPGQTVSDLAQDILFFDRVGADMIGMGPYLTHPDAPLSAGVCPTQALSRDELLRLTLNMIAATRIVLADVNIAATTALQAVHPLGREAGLRFGANVLMPLATPENVRADYLLYSGKPCVDEGVDECSTCLLGRARSVGREVALNEWGDSPHATRRSR